MLYPIGPGSKKYGPGGNLRKGVRVRSFDTSGNVARAKVINVSPHSHLYEEGTEIRRTKDGVNRGRMPATPVLRKIAPRKRREMVLQLINMVEQQTGAKINRG